MKKEQVKRNRRGMVLVLIAVLMVILIVIGVALLQLGLRSRVQAARSAAGIAAQTAADAGLAQAFYQMNEKLKETRLDDIDWDNSWIPYQSTVTDLSNASFIYEITGNPNSYFTVASTGQSSIIRKIVYSRLKARSLWMGIGVKDTLVAKNNATFSTIPAGGDFVIRTNSIEPGAVLFNNGVQFPGDVIVGPGGNPVPNEPDSVIILKEGAVIEGETYSAPELFFPEVIPPDDLVDWGYKINFKGEDKIVGESGDYQSGIYTGAIIKSAADPGKLIIRDPNVVLYFTGDFDLNTNSELIVEDGASVTIYLGASLLTGNDSAITNENVTDPSTATDDELAAGTMALKLYGTDTCTSIDIKTKSDFFGAIYAREAHLLLRNDGDLYGAFVSKSLEMKNSSGFFCYIEALSHIDIDDETATGFEIFRWWE